MCQHLTHDPQKVLFNGWNKELKWPTQINLCPRCHELWIPDVNVTVHKSKPKQWIDSEEKEKYKKQIKMWI